MHDQPLLRMSLPSIPSFVLSGLLLLCLPFSSFASATTSHISFSYAARQRMQNRARLLKQYQTHLKKQASYIVEGNAESRRALRQHNREQIKQHPEWFPAPLKASDRRWQALAENNHFLSSDHLHFMPTTRSSRRSSHVRPMRCITIAGQRLWRTTTCAGEICCFSISTAARLPTIWACIWAMGNLSSRHVPAKPFG